MTSPGLGSVMPGKFGVHERKHGRAVHEFEPEQKIAHEKAFFHGARGDLEGLDHIHDGDERHREGRNHVLGKMENALLLRLRGASLACRLFFARLFFQASSGKVSD